MKLFQRLLVAPATLGLLAPLSVNANELNLNEINTYSDVESIEFANSFDKEESNVNLLLAGGEGLMDDHDHGPEDSFSSTTSASFSVDMAIGAVDGGSTEKVSSAYGYQIDLSTSFTGEDALSVSLDAGAGAADLAELDLNSGGDQLTVDGITYSFPLGEKATVLVGDSTDGSALYSTACVYGGFTNTLDDCGNYASAFTTTGATSAGFSASYDIGNGFTGAIGYAGAGTGEGFMTSGGTDYYGAQVAYAADNYGVSVTYANLEDVVETDPTTDATVWGFNGYYTPEGSLPSISVGYEMGDTATDAVGDTTQWFVGLQWDEAGPGTLGVAAGSKGPILEDAEELMAYEAFYSYPVNDSMTVTPAVFLLENATGTDDQTGFVVKTSFSF